MSKRPAPEERGDSERLPWLEPYREVIADKRRAERRSHGGLVAVAGVFAVLMAAMGGYWLGQRGERAVTQPAPVQSRPTFPATPPPAEAPPAADSIEALPEPSPEPEPAVEAEKPRQAAERTKPAPPRKASIRKADTRRTTYDRVTAKQREAVRTWPKMPSPGPPGQVIQLGAFSTRARAEAAYRQRTARYPLLAGMPQVVVPIVTRPRGEVLYVLRLGTQTRQQSHIVCRNLRRSGDHCLVIG